MAAAARPAPARMVPVLDANDEEGTEETSSEARFSGVTSVATDKQ